ncbi:protein-(glutamine-N5) methyltransferase, release factor-specific, partial [bacterium]|nr:protein-(glutamine-N5) methyltransferase, release factor-specific [bacterium]
MNVQEAVDQGTSILESKGVESPRLSAEILVGFVTSQTRDQVLARSDRRLSPQEENQFRVVLDRRQKHEPIPYIVGEVEFYS